MSLSIDIEKMSTIYVEINLTIDIENMNIKKMTTTRVVNLGTTTKLS